MSGRSRWYFAAATASVLLLAGCVTKPPAPVAKVPSPPPAPREFRAVWVATVANIDWPSKPGLSTAQQHAEIIAILDRARELRLNAVIFQVRPAADALYASSLEPWSEYLTGTQGGSPGYDPLAVWVVEAHRRGLELHAWFNPYRARHHEAKSPFAPNHLAKTNPGSVKKYGDLWWMDPGDAIASGRTLAVVADVVSRYDIDGVHIDDYFYPYPSAVPRPRGSDVKEMLDFPDEPSWKEYRKGGGKLARADWRRQNVDQLVERIYGTIHALKPWVKFGISPFGLGRPDRRPPGIEGFSQYDQLYANVERWVEQGWFDYLTPQLYWPVAGKAQAFGVLLDYWARQNTMKRHLWPGLFTSKIGDETKDPKAWAPAEIMQQIAVTRANPAAGGHVHFSLVALLQDRRGIATQLRAIYAQPALVPATPWLGTAAPAAPKLQREADGRIRIIPAAKGEAATNFAVWRKQDDAWNFSVQPASEPMVVPADAEALSVSAVDRLGNESPAASLWLIAPKPKLKPKP
ncbi:MAG: family 10 glycosylhydrolase [Lacunisphaera sp.]|nr:family 10 glycosylhydrolase [Lacunisphaera sp.]